MPGENSGEKTRLAVEVLGRLRKHLLGKGTHLQREKRLVESAAKKLSEEKQEETLQKTAFRVLIGTILSHRTRDGRTEEATRALLSKYSSPEKLSKATVAKIRELIKLVGFYNSKAKYVKKCSQELVQKFGGKVPNTMEALTSLTGVGRKTAGCVIAYAFELPAIPVDSHCHRVGNRLGLVKTSTPEETEQELMKIVPRARWVEVNELFVLHGQSTCAPISPFCSRCPLAGACPKIGVKNSR